MGYGVVLAAMIVCAAGTLAGQAAAKKPVAKAPAKATAKAAAKAAPAKPVELSPAITSPTDTLTSKFDVAGIPVILRRVTANNVVAANLYLLGGTRQLTAANQGIETLLLEASERGTAKYPRDVLRTKMARLGSAIGVGANADWTTISLRATTTGLDSTWAILADRVMAPRLDPADFDPEQVDPRIEFVQRQRREVFAELVRLLLLSTEKAYCVPQYIYQN
jgi:zinc protease